ncbi:hypothetical protein BDD12DRAFT_33818 [Trichophaea hybrida]|nr:hypothetical protein BDD12DRAFT_33818 [Trichophaea hybrida]
MSSNQNSDRLTCYRITGIPSHWGKNELQQKLAEIARDINLENIELSIFRTCCYFTKTQTALLRLKSSTTYFEWWKQSKESFLEQGRTVRLNIDKQFYGLTPLNNPNEPITADIIAITGLAGHAFGSWQNRSTHEMWLYDYLPEQFESARIMTYGYNSSLLEPNGARLTDHRKDFMEKLCNARFDCPKRPIIFIGHSLGGILVVQTMLQSFNQLGQNTAHRDIFDAVRGIFFFGTPHQGLNVGDLRELVAMQAQAERDNYELPQLLDQLNNDSEFLVNQKDACISMWEQFTGKICSFYETEKTKTVVSVGGTVQRGGPKVQKVLRFSAVLGIGQESSVPIISNHADMVKFANVDGAFGTVVRHINEWLARSNRAAFQSVIDSVKSGDISRHFPPVNQKEHVDRLMTACTHDEDGKFFWIFQNIDYKIWKGGSRTLVLSAPPERDLEQAACYIRHELQKFDADTLPLHFFRRAVEQRHCSIWRSVPKQDRLIAVSLYSFVWQLIHLQDSAKVRPQPILSTFLGQLLSCRDDSELDQIPDLVGGSMGKVELLFQLASLDDLLNAFEKALEVALNVRLNAITPRSAAPYTGGGSQPNQQISSLTFIFDLDNPPVNIWKLLLDNIRIVQRHLPAAKLLVTNPPSTTHLGLDISLLEVHIEYDKERKACLRSLSFDNSRYKNIAAHHELTLEWLLKSDEYNSWISSKFSSTLFIEGKPGSGKSTLVRFLRDKLVSSLHDTKPDIIADFFYSSRDGELHQSHEIMLQSLLYHILQADESCFELFQETYRLLPQLGLPSSDGIVKWTYNSLKKILQECSIRQRKSKLVIIVDALDESDSCDHRQDILMLLCKLAATEGNCVKLCLASRPINDLPKGFDSNPGYYRLLLQDKNMQDIEKYTRSFLNELPVHLDHENKEEALGYILKNAEGVFVWVHLIERDLKSPKKRGRSQEELMRFLMSLPTDLEKYYERMLGELADNDSSNIEYGKRILQFCLFSHRPISLVELLATEAALPP